MNKQKKKNYCKLRQALINLASILAVSAAVAFYLVYALIS